MFRVIFFLGVSAPLLMAYACLQLGHLAELASQYQQFKAFLQ